MKERGEGDGVRARGGGVNVRGGGGGAVGSSWASSRHVSIISTSFTRSDKRSETIRQIRRLIRFRLCLVIRPVMRGGNAATERSGISR